MSTYVDTVRSYPGAGLRFTEFCHLLADERAELHQLAARIGMPRRTFQDHPWRWHYDLPAHLRVEALRLGAREVDLAFVGRMLRDRRLVVTRDAGAAGAGGGTGAPTGGTYAVGGAGAATDGAGTNADPA